jgi:hypothetical protein
VRRRRIAVSQLFGDTRDDVYWLITHREGPHGSRQPQHD